MNCCNCGQPLPVEGLVIDRENGMAKSKDRCVHLSPGLLQFADVLVRRSPNYMSAEVLFTAIYGDRSDPPFEGTMRVQLHNLSAALSKIGYFVENKRGIGWRLKACA